MPGNQPLSVLHPLTVQSGDTAGFYHQNPVGNSAGSFSSILSKEVRKPLTIISLALEILQSSENSTSQKEYLALIQNSAVRITELMSLQLAYDAREVCYRPVTMNRLIDEVLALHSGMIKLNNVEISRNYEETNAQVVFDESSMVIALSNIMINAIEAMANKKAELKIITKSGMGFFLVEITDNGAGIKESHLPFIFTPHYTEKKRRSGMGLALAYDLLAANGVQVSIRSVEDQGTSLMLCFLQKDAPRHYEV